MPMPRAFDYNCEIHDGETLLKCHKIVDELKRAIHEICPSIRLPIRIRGQVAN